ncbi:MAG TPA: hypothetical protein VG125_04985 [Pirellulales bacterium]|jgi:hypothetical protein|nr:hypothetical protein [Pirellulales bacterium]
MPAIQPGETWWVALRHERRRLTVLEPATLERWWKCRDVLTGSEFIAREDWFIERELPGRRRKRRSADDSPPNDAPND